MKQLWLLSLMAIWLICSCTSLGHNNVKRVNIVSITDVEGTSIFSTDLVLSPDGVSHLAYVSDLPAYTIRYQQLARANETVGMAGNQQHSEVNLSLALNSAEQPGIAYVDDRSGDLIYAEREANQWITTTVEATGQVGHFASLAYDHQGQPHISYADNSNNDIKYATRSGEGWHIETIDATGQPGFHIPAGFTQLALSTETNSDGETISRPHVAYLGYRYKPYDGELRYATRYDWGWQIETVDSATGAGGFPSMAIDQNGQPWISYYLAGTWDFHYGQLRLAHHNGRRWQVEIIDDDNNAGRYNALALTAAGQPVIAYYAATIADLRLAWWDSQWHRTTLLTEGNVGASITLAIDAADTVHITYANVGTGITEYAIVNIEN